MSSKSRRQDPSLVGNLLEAPEAWSFFQAVRILERAAHLAGRNSQLGQRLARGSGVGGFAPPASEVLRLQTNQSFRFPEAEIHSIERKTDGESPRWIVRVAFMGLTGAMGVMPFHYTELILQRLKLKDAALAHFLDLFNHRSLSLFYRAATKYRLPLAYERGHLAAQERGGRPENKRDSQTQALLSLIGLATPALQNRMEVRDESLLYYSGHLTQQVRTAVGLKQILADYFEVPVQVQEFIGQWRELMPDARSRLASRAMPRGQNIQLGRSVIAGHKGWFAQGKIRILLGPLDREQFQRFAPGTRSLRALNELVRFYVGLERDYDFVIEVKRKDVPSKIALSRKTTPVIGWNTWLSSTGQSRKDGDDTLRITVSANRLK